MEREAILTYKVHGLLLSASVEIQMHLIHIERTPVGIFLCLYKDPDRAIGGADDL